MSNDSRRSRPAAPSNRTGKAEAEPRGICDTCAHAATCLFLKAARHPVWHCEEFDEGTEKRPPVTREASVAAASSPTNLGLCATCDERGGCKLARPAVVVYQCEEFR